MEKANAALHENSMGTSQIQSNFQRILRGKEPKHLLDL